MIPSHYYTHVRSEILSLLPESATQILDIGCGVGATSKWLKNFYPAARTVGLEGNPELIKELSLNVDEAHIIDLNVSFPDVGNPDLVLCLDVLEHLIRPDDVLRHIASVMTDWATVIISLPNVAHLRVSGPLFICGRFNYQDAGILDRTHLHFYTQASAYDLVQRVGLEIVGMVRNGLEEPGARRSNRLFNFLTGGLLSNRFTEQYVLAARRPKQVGKFTNCRL